MIKLTLKDGSIREIEAAQSAAEIVKGIGMGLYKAACCVKINGETKDLRTVIDSDCEFEVMTFDSIEGKKTFWHTASHILAQAVKRLYPSAKLASLVSSLAEVGYNMMSGGVKASSMIETIMLTFEW